MSCLSKDIFEIEGNKKASYEHILSEIILILQLQKHVFHIMSYKHSPVHVKPLPSNPGLHWQLKLPMVLVQFAFTSQLWKPSAQKSAPAHYIIKAFSSMKFVFTNHFVVCNLFFFF